MPDTQATEDFIVEAVVEADPTIVRIYEAGYHISPSVKEEDVEKIVAEVRATVEKNGGSFIAEGAPQLIRLAYALNAREGGKYVSHDRAYFGWLKFEAPVAAAAIVNDMLKANNSVIRALVFKTVREDTRAQIKTAGLRDVKRTDTIKATPRKEATEGPVSEEDIDKAIEGLTTE